MSNLPGLSVKHKLYWHFLIQIINDTPLRPFCGIPSIQERDLLHPILSIHLQYIQIVTLNVTIQKQTSSYTTPT